MRNVSSMTSVLELMGNLHFYKKVISYPPKSSHSQYFISAGSASGGSINEIKIVKKIPDSPPKQTFESAAAAGSYLHNIHIMLGVTSNLAMVSVLRSVPTLR